MAETLTKDSPLAQGGAVGWLRSNPLEAVLIATLTATLFYFFGIWGSFGPSRSASTLEWMWNVCEPGEAYDYGHGRFIPLVIAFLVWRSRKAIAAAPRGSSWLGMVCIIVGVLLFILAARMIQVRLAAVGFPLLLWGVIAYGWGKEVARHFIFPCFLFAFAIPMPGLIQATNGLQVIATKIAYGVSTALGADIVQDGTNINSAVEGKWGKALSVAEGCSGVRSLVALTFIAAVYGHLTQNKLWKKIALLACSLPLAIIANSMRVTTIVLIAEYYSADFAAKSYHNFSGFIFFPLGLAGLLFCSFLINGGWKKAKQTTRVTTVGPKPSTGG
jgi:exosortase